MAWKRATSLPPQAPRKFRAVASAREVMESELWRNAGLSGDVDVP